MKRLLLDFLHSYLHDLGAFRRPGQTVSAAREAAGLLPAYEGWFAECVWLLKAEGRLAPGGGRVRPLDELWREWVADGQEWQRNPDLAATYLLVDAMLRALPDILTGKRPATEVMFPGASMELVENAYKTNPASEFFNRALADTVVSHLKRAAVTEPRILEIGAGTGATSAVLLDALRAEGLPIREYRYTDVSRAFLDHARRSYGPANPFLSYGVLDIERPPAGQGITVGSYDVVVAANVLHATRNIHSTLRNTKATLKKGGLLLLNELTVNNLLNQFTFGLLEGWWRYDDPRSRIPGSPILSADGWRRALTDEGYGPITFPASEAADLGQQIIVAESDGVVRQPRALPEPAAQPTARPAARPAENPGGATTAPALARVEATVLDVLAETLRIDRSRIARHEPFAGYGLDSIYAVNVARTVGEKLDLDLDITILFEHGTLAELVEFITAEYGSDIQAAAAQADAQTVDAQADAQTVVAQVEQAVQPDAEPAGAESATAAQEADLDGMAIVGMSARFPQADDIDEFWHVVEQGTRCITTPPMRRADWALRGEGADTAGIQGGFMAGIHEFDPLFFGMSMTEARQVTPESRLMLMAAWNAVEDAGHRLADLRARPTGVFVAAGPSEYQAHGQDSDGGPSLTGLPSPAMIPNRISYLLDLHGPSEQCDTTCSSSLVALHRAIRSIRDGECDQAIVGGVNLVMSPAGFAGMRAAGMLSAGGNVRPFQDGADGTVRSEGAGAILIKPLSRAVEDGDTVYAVVRGTGVAHGGRGLSFTAPNIRGMKSAIAAAYADAGVDPGTVSYVETHGMSSALADGAEIAALGAGLRGDSTDAVYLGSVKPCIGHTEVFSGLAALVKTVEVMRRGVIPAIPGFGRLHPDISLAGTRLRMATQNMPWPVRTDAVPRRASINSFGIGGVNAHVVLEHRPEGGDASDEDTFSSQILVLSARTESALLERARNLVGWLKNADAARWADIAYTLQVGREPMDFRLALVATGADEAREVLEGWLNDDQAMRTRVSFSDGKQRDHGISDDAALATRPSLDVIADQWVAGASVDWSELHQGTKRRRIPLPGYPFEQRTCFDMRTPDWTAATPTTAVSAAATATATAATAAASESGAATGPEDFVTGLVASVLGLGRQEIDSGRSLADYGLNSLLATGLLSRIRSRFPAFQPDWLQPNDTLDDVIARLSDLAAGGDVPVGSQFPELVHLNAVTEGRPVFWVHGALASVESYSTIAAKIDRPFYGIQARGFLTDHAPIEGVERMAEYYTEIIRAVQPDGPYDLGGFCLGGIVSYEIARLLQSRGQAVDSLIMVDSPDGTGLAKSNATGSQSAQSAALQVVNSLLWPAGETSLAAVGPKLIHQDEIDGALDEERFVQRLADLAVERGLSMSREQIAHFTLRNIGVQLAYGITEYEVRPLTSPKTVDCTYFRNRRGLFLGELEPYFQVVGETFSLDHIDYSQDWRRELPGLRMVDIDAANHMTILHDEEPLAAIEQACVQTYRVDTSPNQH